MASVYQTAIEQELTQQGYDPGLAIDIYLHLLERTDRTPYNVAELTRQFIVVAKSTRKAPFDCLRIVEGAVSIAESYNLVLEDAVAQILEQFSKPEGDE